MQDRRSKPQPFADRYKRMCVCVKKESEINILFQIEILSHCSYKLEVRFLEKTQYFYFTFNLNHGHMEPVCVS